MVTKSTYKNYLDGVLVEELALVGLAWLSFETAKLLVKAGQFGQALLVNEKYWDGKLDQNLTNRWTS